MTTQDYNEWRQGKAAFRQGVPFSFSRPHCWRMGWCEGQRLARPAAKSAETIDDIDPEGTLRQLMGGRSDGD